jgi:AcrR family transcriptional regulator
MGRFGGDPMSAGRTQAERREATRAALIESGRKLFSTRGYDAVGTEEIVAAAGVTRGALYHHFDGKRGLFAAVFEHVERELTQRFPFERLTGEDPFGALSIGIETFLDLSLDLEVQRITLIDGPAVLGWEDWHELEGQYGLGLIEAALGAAMEAGQIRELPTAELAAVLLGALMEAALQLARATDPKAARERAAGVLRALLEGLRT